jgi:hypothetical protein
MHLLPRCLQALNNSTFASLYLAQTINLIGDALTWLGLALLAFELAGEGSGAVLAGALTLRVTVLPGVICGGFLPIQLRAGWGNIYPDTILGLVV